MSASTQNQDAPPTSATHMGINLTGLVCAGMASAWLVFNPDVLDSRTWACVLVGLAWALPIAGLEALFLKPWRRESAGLTGSGFQPKIQRVIVKLLALAGCITAVALTYWLLPEYQGTFYDPFYTVLFKVLPYWLLFAVPYVWWVDGWQTQPQDSYWLFGRWLLGRETWCEALTQLLLGWAVKGFFLPLMFVYLGNNLTQLINTDFSAINGSFQSVFDAAFNVLYYVDLLIVCVGYSFTLRLLDSHIRSTEPSLLGWAVALACYQPFWSLISGTYIQYDQGPAWGYWFWATPWAYTLWGSAILCCIGIYVWASMAFGLRFSNLTHRGILTNGPFRWTKHPAYLSKNLSWWLISMPFMVSVSLEQSVRQCGMLLLLNGIYFIRAKTEERHLSRDPVYRQYMLFIAKHGLMARLKNLIARMLALPMKPVSGAEENQ
ncbi:methyltransferase family protein [Simiduia agarivorans]|uniref:Isoprenylcysteine carboxyl methyltransferase family protein n=1 Tax=Simiduia agarivorans (strain DSM 21679 / JCM 13881 / BCRC 17597 / SA1) TaxID=1117647 RepID=K4KWY7_SIMAS|nr:isoprenylcysteine carboxylmethyltransferase family protein [Simiduia agarivorans]AFU98457.2 isoprenylcysteine carboxyl methyltransferase family protein [Simiduia agarivorans SA1 = DSM 21679]